jgi:LacI family transcriptional regulator
MEKKNKPTIKKIADLAGVSLATVSNALNNKRGVNEETSRQVLTIARELGYFEHNQKSTLNRPLRDIRAIRVIKFRRHGLVVQDTPFFAELLNGIENECNRQGFELLFAQIMGREQDDRRRMKQLLEDKQVANIILATEMSSDDLELLVSAQAPLILLDSYFRGSNLSSVTINNTEAGYTAVKHLIANGHQQIGIINSSAEFNNMHYRWLGYREALSQAGLPIRPEWVVSVEPTVKGSHRDMLGWLAQNKPLPTAFFAANDMIAAGAVRALQEKSIQVPFDVSIIAMDNTPICQAVSPALSTIHVFKQELGVAAVRELLASAQSKEECSRLLELGIKLVERSSVMNIFS